MTKELGFGLETLPIPSTWIGQMNLWVGWRFAITCNCNKAFIYSMVHSLCIALYHCYHSEIQNCVGLLLSLKSAKFMC